MLDHGSLNVLFRGICVLTISSGYVSTVVQAKLDLNEGPKLGDACDIDVYSKGVLPIQMAYTSAVQHKARREFGANFQRTGKQNISCFGYRNVSYDKIETHYRCDEETKTCICNDKEPLAKFPDSSDPSGCSSKSIKPGEPCDYAFASKVEEQYFSNMYGNKRFKGKNTTKYDIAFYYVEYAKFRDELLEIGLRPANKRRLCLDTHVRTMKCNSSNKCECLNDGDNFKFKQVGDECIGEKGTVCKIEFLGNYTHQDIQCDPEHPCDVAKSFFEGPHTNQTDTNFIVKACGGLWGKEDNDYGVGWRVTYHKILLYSTFSMMLLNHYVFLT